MILMPKFEVPGADRPDAPQEADHPAGRPDLVHRPLQYSRMRSRRSPVARILHLRRRPLPAELRDRFESFSGAGVVEGYGLSETSPVVALNPLNGVEKDGSIGQPLPRTTSRSAPRDPRVAMPLGERGEICVRGPQVMMGYWNRPEDTGRGFRRRLSADRRCRLHGRGRLSSSSSIASRT